MRTNDGMLRAGLTTLAFLLFCEVVPSAEATEFHIDPLATPYITWVGSATSQGDGVMNTDDARSTYGVDGNGIKIGVISDSYNGSGSTPTVDTQISNGDLPGAGNPNGYTTAVTPVKDDSGRDEGRAMLEIVHDIAPGAELYFHSAFNNTGGAPSQTIADAVTNLAAQGCNVIVDDVGILTQSRFQDGPAAQAVDAAKAAGIAYFSSAGNSANDATRHTYTGGAGGTLNFGTNDVLELYFPEAGYRRVAVQWTEPYESISGAVGSSADFAVDVTDTAGNTIFSTVDNRTAGDDPLEFFGINSSGSGSFGVRVRHLSGNTGVDVQVSVFDGLSIIDADDTNAPTVHGHAAAEGAVSVAAHFHNEPGLDEVESFSSVGPTEILFDTDGHPIADTRQTPLLTAPDGVTTTTDGFLTFFGTSAAAPHVAAVSALMLERASDLGYTLGVDELYDILYNTAIDIETTGFDNLSGYGRVDALSAVGAVIPEPTTLTLLLAGMALVVTRRRTNA